MAVNELPTQPLTGTMAVGATPVPVVGRSMQRKSLILNNVGTTTLYVGTSADVTPTTGFALNANQALITNVKWEWYVVSATTGTLAYLDEFV